jgi:hypothetical protein
MRSPVKLAVLVVSLAFVSISGQQRTTSPAGATTYRAPRLDGHPDLNGIWQAMVTANWNLQDHDAQAGLHPEIMGAYGAEPAGQSVVEGGEIPYQAMGTAKEKRKFRKARDRRRQQRQEVA